MIAIHMLSITNIMLTLLTANLEHPCCTAMLLLTHSLCLQSAGLTTTVVLTSAAVFCVHCMLQQDKAAALHPPLMYACIVALLLLPLDTAFKVWSLHLLLAVVDRLSDSDMVCAMQHSTVTRFVHIKAMLLVALSTT